MPEFKAHAVTYSCKKFFLATIRLSHNTSVTDRQTDRQTTNDN